MATASDTLQVGEETERETGDVCGERERQVMSVERDR